MGPAGLWGPRVSGRVLLERWHRRWGALRGEQAVCLEVRLHKGHTEVDVVEGLLVNAKVGKTLFPSSSSVLAL